MHSWVLRRSDETRYNLAVSIYGEDEPTGIPEIESFEISV